MGHCVDSSVWMVKGGRVLCPPIGQQNYRSPGEGLSTWPVRDTPRSDRTWPRGDLGLHGIPWSTQRWAPAPKALCTPVHPGEEPSHQRAFGTPHAGASLLRGTLKSSLVSRCTKHAVSNTQLFPSRTVSFGGDRKAGD